MRLLLIQFRTDASAPHEERCVRVHAELDSNDLVVANPMTHPTVVEHLRHTEFDGVIIGGSGEFNLTHKAPELRTALDLTKPLIDAMLADDRPFLGLCFGHQLLAEHLGGTVETMADGPKAGTYHVRLTAHGREDPFHAQLPEQFVAQHGHKDAVTKLPAGAIALSQSDHDRHASYRYGKRTYGVQYHGELTQDDMLFRIGLYPSYVAGKTEKELEQLFQPTPHPTRLLRNFRRIVEAWAIERTDVAIRV